MSGGDHSPLPHIGSVFRWSDPSSNGMKGTWRAGRTRKWVHTGWRRAREAPGLPAEAIIPAAIEEGEGMGVRSDVFDSADVTGQPYCR